MANATNPADGTSRLFAAIREAQDQALRLDDQNEHARARARLLHAVEAKPLTAAEPVGGRSQAGSRWGWGLGAGLAAAACAAAILFVLPELSERGDNPKAIASLEFRLDGAEIAEHQQVVADAAPRLLAVSDDTRLDLAPYSSLYIDGVRSNGATVVLEQGEVSLSVHHEHDTSWRVTAGPWSVHVTGTQFVVAWEPSSEHFRVAVSEGSVRVEGPEGEVAQLGAGDELVRTHGKPTIEPDADTDDVAFLDPAPQILDGPDPIADAPSPTKSIKASARRWDRYFEDADYQGAWDALAGQPGGIHGEADRVADARTMLDLADVARFTKHGSDTRKLLERLRVRFPDSTEAGEAAFTLGRLAADGGSQAKAAVWFERYLDERPNGSFAGDALGRLMDCYDALGQASDAKSAAQRYLAGQPSGPHSAKAKAILAR